MDKNRLINSFCKDLQNQLRDMPSNSSRFTGSAVGYVSFKDYTRYFSASVNINRANEISISNIKCFMENDGIPYEPDFIISIPELTKACKNVLNQKRTGSVTEFGGNMY